MPRLLLALLLAGCAGAPPPEASQEEGFGFPYCYDYRHCTSNAQCPSGQYCWGGDCRLNPMATRCEWYYDPVVGDGAYVARNAAGDRQNCVPYACNWSTGSCGDRCTTAADCAVGFVCDEGNCNAAAGGYSFTSHPPTVPPDREMAGLCSNACGDRAGKSYETCYNGYWLPSTTRCYDNQSMLFWGYYWDSCGEYACNWVRGFCDSECGTAGDCAVGYSCDTDHICKYTYP